MHPPQPSPLGLLFLLTLATGATARPQDPEELADLDLEDLLSVQVPSMTSVLGSHVHNQGEWMPMVRYMSMHMDGLRDGTDDLSTAEVLLPGGTYMVAPLEMDMSMTMVGLMYGVTDNVTLMGMIPFHERSMDLRTMGGTEFTTRSDGPGDVRLTALCVGWEDYDRQLIWSFGISLPTGSIDEHDDTPMGPNMLLPYPMQLGSGTYDLVPGLTYVSEGEYWSFGVKSEFVLRLGRNEHSYSLGDRVSASTWVERSIGRQMSVSGGLRGIVWGNVDGADSGLNPSVAPPADPNQQGGMRGDLSVGYHLFSQRGALAGNRLDLEVGVPIYEDLDGPQMSTEFQLLLSWSMVR